MQVRPLTPDGVARHLAALVVARPEDRLRVLIDGHPSAHPAEFADALVDPLQEAGRRVVRVHADDFLRAASVRLEYGRRDADGYFDRVDSRALAREVIDPWGRGSGGRYLPTLWDAQRDRATRAPYLDVPERGVLLLDGALLLGRWLDLDLTVHLALRSDTMIRRTPEEKRWALPAFERYQDEVAPEEVADVVLRVDDPRHPALVLSD